MPLPKIEEPSGLYINGLSDGGTGETARRLVKVVKPYKGDMPDILDRLLPLANAAKQKETP